MFKFTKLCLLQSPGSSTVSTEVKVHKPTFSKYHFYDVAHEKYFSEKEKVSQNETIYDLNILP